MVHPQLSEAQLLWIASAIKQASSTAKGADVLIWGLGYDSRVWAALNRRGRTIFLENYQEWIQKVLRDLPDLEVYATGYNATMAKADAYFAAPWLISLPAAVEALCFDVILVDAPQGFAPDHPGRMEAAYWSVNNAVRCTRGGQKGQVSVFLHDVNRKMEQRIMAELMRPKMEELGMMKGWAGDLAGFVLKHS